MKRPSELSIEELLKSKIRITGVLIAYAIIVVMMLLIYLYLCFFKSVSVTVTPFVVLPVMWIPISISLKNIINEIEIRQSNNG